MAKDKEHQEDCYKDYEETFDEDRVAEKPGYYCLRCGVELNTPKERRYGLCKRHFEMAVRGR